MRLSPAIMVGILGTGSAHLSVVDKSPFHYVTLSGWRGGRLNQIHRLFNDVVST